MSVFALKSSYMVIFSISLGQLNYEITDSILDDINYFTSHGHHKLQSLYVD